MFCKGFWKTWALGTRAIQSKQETGSKDEVQFWGNLTAVIMTGGPLNKESFTFSKLYAVRICC